MKTMDEKTGKGDTICRKRDVLKYIDDDEKTRIQRECGRQDMAQDQTLKDTDSKSSSSGR